MTADDEPMRSEATVLVDRLQQGDLGAAEQLLPLVYDQLRALAARYSQGQPTENTLQPTALVHEAFLKMVNAKNQNYRGKEHFCAVAATAMRQILSTYAERKRTLKRGGDAKQVSLSHVTLSDKRDPVDTLDLDAALTRLELADEKLSRVTELLYFGGLQLDEAAKVLGISRSTVARRWRQARAFLNHELTKDSDS